MRSAIERQSPDAFVPSLLPRLRHRFAHSRCPARGCGSKLHASFRPRVLFVGVFIARLRVTFRVHLGAIAWFRLRRFSYPYHCEFAPSRCRCVLVIASVLASCCARHQTYCEHIVPSRLPGLQHNSEQCVWRLGAPCFTTSI